MTYDFERTQGDKAPYLLLAPFIEGMCQGADAGTQITDAFEQSYNYRSRTAFEVGRANILAARQLFTDKAAFDRHMHVGFCLWIDYGSNRRPWSPTEFDHNYFQPQTWQNAVHYALSYSDKYLWVHTERLNWWTGEHRGPAYVAATNAGRAEPVQIDYKQTAPTAEQEKYMVTAASRDHGEAFAELLKTHQLLTDLPKDGWMFRIDPDELGVAQQWFAPDLDQQAWSPIEVGKFWHEQGWDYDGYGWYRRSFAMDSIPAGKTILLAVGAADQSATVWLNGQKVGEHDVGGVGWDKLFTCDITHQAAPRPEPVDHPRSRPRRPRRPVESDQDRGEMIKSDAAGRGHGSGVGRWRCPSVSNALSR